MYLKTILDLMYNDVTDIVYNKVGSHMQATSNVTLRTHASVGHVKDKSATIRAYVRRVELLVHNEQDPTQKEAIVKSAKECLERVQYRMNRGEQLILEDSHGSNIKGQIIADKVFVTLMEEICKHSSVSSDSPTKMNWFGRTNFTEHAEKLNDNLDDMLKIVQSQNKVAQPTNNPTAQQTPRTARAEGLHAEALKTPGTARHEVAQPTNNPTAQQTPKFSKEKSEKIVADVSKFGLISALQLHKPKDAADFLLDTRKPEKVVSDLDKSIVDMPEHAIKIITEMLKNDSLDENLKSQIIQTAAIALKNIIDNGLPGHAIKIANQMLASLYYSQNPKDLDTIFACLKKMHSISGLAMSEKRTTTLPYCVMLRKDEALDEKITPINPARLKKVNNEVKQLLTPINHELAYSVYIGIKDFDPEYAEAILDTYAQEVTLKHNATSILTMCKEMKLDKVQIHAVFEYAALYRNDIATVIDTISTPINHSQANEIISKVRESNPKRAEELLNTYIRKTASKHDTATILSMCTKMNLDKAQIHILLEHITLNWDNLDNIIELYSTLTTESYIENFQDEIYNNLAQLREKDYLKFSDFLSTIELKYPNLHSYLVT